METTEIARRALISLAMNRAGVDQATAASLTEDFLTEHEPYEVRAFKDHVDDATGHAGKPSHAWHGGDRVADIATANADRER